MSSSSRIIKQDIIKSKGEMKLSHLNEEQEESTIDVSYAESAAKEIISDAKVESEEIINKAIIKAKEIEKKAYEEGYDQGTKNGYEDGYKEVYVEYIDKAKIEAKEIVSNAENMLLDANKMIAEYIKSIQNDMIKTCVNISSKVINKHFEDESSMNDMLESIIKKYEVNGSIVVKCNKLYENELQEKIDTISEKETNTKIFLSIDENINKGDLIIKKQEGTITMSVDSAIEKLREELIGE